jgi:hypothetical protein
MNRLLKKGNGNWKIRGKRKLAKVGEKKRMKKSKRRRHGWKEKGTF